VTCDALTNYERLCSFSDVPDGGAHEVAADIGGTRESLILLRRGDDVAAYFNVCPHAGRRLDWAPGRFLLDQGLLVCAAHGACFSVPEGACVSGPCRGQRLAPVAITLHGDGIYLAPDAALRTSG
jgi:nitrite reductase/ring-hydroxylating ferredoxin subunit